MTRSTIDAHDYATTHETTYPSSAVSLMEGVERLEDLDPVSAPSSIDIDRANLDDEPERGDRAQATTPLLPPLMIPESASTTKKASPVQSPLQSPTVAESCETFSIVNSPLIDRAGTVTAPAVHAPLASGMPTPPLSSKPSVGSLRRPSNVTAHLVPADEIPQMRLADPSDIWSQKLGHANFDIHPEPYLPPTFSATSREQFHSDWALARCNFTKQLVRTGEHFGTTSMTYLLTEEKWSEIDATWRAHNEAMLSEMAATAGEHEVLEERAAAAAGTLVEIPELDVRGAEGKFPKLGDEVIVGPMVQIASRLQRKRSASRKARVLKWVKDVKMSGVGGLGIRLGRGRSRTQ
jgi:hypothetical protein